MAERVVLAYSGGLDTSVAVRWLIENEGVEVIAVAVNVGQAAERGGEDWDAIRTRALAAGAVEAVVVDARTEMAEEFCVPALQANARYEGKYPLVSALSRPVIVRHLVAEARRHGATAVAHGCTGKGNDQVRFEVGTRSLAPDLGIYAPARVWGLTRGGLRRAGRQVGDPHHGDQGQAVLHRRQPVGQGHRVRRHRGPVGPRARRRVHADPGHRDRAGRGHRRLRGRRAGLAGRRVAGPRAADRQAGPHRREPRLRPARHGGEPPGRDQEPGGLRVPGRAVADHRPRRSGGPDARARPAPREGPPRAALVRAGLRRPVVLAAQVRARCVHRRVPAPRHRRGAPALRPAGHLHRGRPAQPGGALRPRPGHLRRLGLVPPRRCRGLRPPVGPRRGHLVGPPGPRVPSSRGRRAAS